ncbi:helix-turn-helix domain-containing protein [Pseudokineococcus sp. 1T1Z-3]|uniref:helix-turn-helix domain-containing protein n=1 Tax=Pseudokineococcus sp. 1T1Z-3 TaxID=3132745 RepID=UPI00403F452F
MLGRRIRHYRRERGLTLRELADAVGSTPSQLSLLENGHREPRLSTVQAVAAALGVSAAVLLEPAPPPDRRAELELELARAQRSHLFASLDVPEVRAGRRLPMDALEALVGLHAELARRESALTASPEEARRANTELRLLMQEHDNFLPEIEELAEEAVAAAGYAGGALTHRAVTRMASALGLEVVHVDDLPGSTRTVTDLRNGRIYLPPASIPGGHGLRSLALQALAHRVLGHEHPVSHPDFLRQRVEISYFAQACLLPRSAALEHLTAAKAARDLAVEDLRDAFGVTHEAAAHRLTNLATHDLDIPLHFLRVRSDGALLRGYVGDGLPLPAAEDGTIEGRRVCRRWTARTVFGETDRTTENYQYTDTPAGTYWCSSQVGESTSGAFSVTVGVPFAHARWFRGRDTSVRRRSTCPGAGCCQQPTASQRRDWQHQAWPSARLASHVVTPLPAGPFFGVDEREVYAFLSRHDPG